MFIRTNVSVAENHGYWFSSYAFGARAYYQPLTDIKTFRKLLNINCFVIVLFIFAKFTEKGLC